MVGTERPVVAITSVGEVPDEVLDALPPIVETRSPGRTARCVHPGLGHPDYAFVPARNQYLARPILDRLAVALGGTAERVLGVADLDLFTPGLNFVFGLAQAGSPAVVALARLRPERWGRPPDPNLLRDRAVKEAVHELGHSYGLDHCPNPSCVMRFSNTLAETDRKANRFCADHEAQLRRMLA